jgi:L-rhamnose-H+ transport protein
MISNPFLGVIFHWLGGLASGSFYVPCRGVKTHRVCFGVDIPA